MTTQAARQHNTNPRNHSLHTRRIPRGTGAKSDPLSRLERQAAAHHRHIRGMKGKVKRKSDRKALENARRRLVEVLRTIAERPWEVSTGTHEIIENAMVVARTIYAKAKKVNGRRRTQRNGSRPREEKGVRAKNLPPEYTGEDDRDEAVNT